MGTRDPLRHGCMGGWFRSRFVVNHLSHLAFLRSLCLSSLVCTHVKFIALASVNGRPIPKGKVVSLWVRCVFTKGAFEERDFATVFLQRVTVHAVFAFDVVAMGLVWIDTYKCLS